jgi:SPP1 family predicted phage head-tail adaptor
MLEAGRLRHRVTLQELSRTDDGMGGYTSEWVDVKTVWAEVKSMTGREYLQAQSIQEDVVTKVTIRYRQVRADYRLVHKGQRYNIKAILPDPSQAEYLVLMCVSGD